MDTSAIDNLLGQLRATAASVSGTAASKAAAPAPGAPDFATVLKNSLDEVSGSQVDAMQRARDFELGVPDSSLNRRPNQRPHQPPRRNLPLCHRQHRAAMRLQ